MNKQLKSYAVRVAQPSGGRHTLGIRATSPAQVREWLAATRPELTLVNVRRSDHYEPRSAVADLANHYSADTEPKENQERLAATKNLIAAAHRFIAATEWHTFPNELQERYYRDLWYALENLPDPSL